MLAYAFQELKQNNYESIKSEPFDKIEDLFAEIIYRATSAQLKQGLHREYVLKSESLPSLRGKLDLYGSLNHKLAQQIKLACEYDELSVNNIFNQIVKTTILILIKNSEVKKGKKDALKLLLPFFKDVDTTDIHRIQWNRLHFDRNSRNYQMLLYLCYFIIENLLFSTEAGDYKLTGFSEESMSRLYEKFILEYFRHHHPYTNPNPAQIVWDLDYGKSSTNLLPIMQTDVTLSIGKRCLIIDAKYYEKALQYNHDRTKLRNAHFYQIYSYVNNLDITHTGLVDGMVLYAKTNEEILPDEVLYFNPGNHIYFRTLDLNQDFSGIRKQLDTIIDLIGS